MPTVQVRPDTLSAWKGPSLLIVNTHGECDGDRLCGFYYHEARFIRALRLEVNGTRPWRCEAASLAPDTLTFNYVHPEISQPGGGGSGQSGDEEGSDEHGVPERALNIAVTYRTRVNHLDVTLDIANHSRQPLTIRVAWIADADFADIQETQGRREQEAAVSKAAGDGRLEFAYRHEQLPLRTQVRGGSEWRATDTGLDAEITLAPQERVSRSFQVVPIDPVHAIADDDAAGREMAWHQWQDGFTAIDVPGNRAVERAIADNVRDFASFPLLTGRSDEWLAMQAGMPLYPAFFGRDAVTAGWQAAMIDRGQSLDAALTLLGRLQSDRVDDWRDEEPGRIPYQVRTGPLARLNLNPYSAYYADFASPLMFVISLANLYAWTGEKACLRRHWDTARRILDWARHYGDADGDGYLEYRTRSSKGTKNQGWKDSGDAIIYDDGSPVPPPIATCELQGYWYVAQELMAALSLVMGAPRDAVAHRRAAVSLKRRFNRDWWVEDEQCVALALDPDKRQVRAVTSNVGHCIATGIVSRDHLPAVVGRLFAPDMFSGWGIRTLSSSHRYYNPLSYHRGSVWAVEQATIVFGLRRFGFDARALDLSKALIELSQLYPDHRIPETLGGHARGERPSPGAYPRANTPQLWNATAFPLVLQSLLGLVPIAPISTLVVDPVLPTWMPELVVRNLRVGEARVSLRFRRTDEGRTSWEVLDQRGTLHVVRQPPPESLSDGFATRAGAVFETLLTRRAG
jgi:glycogen debranching enzyme